ncbi:hypothetical protein [Burkholderia oklahomensis]|uniref:hypothetical protein n=1 Tax=Burkholderia oklahomensis TaxID=342113 RepID=UPI00130D8073|nr:hypothetical protein [Burkholderia oklahomensis]QPS37179.1 hypothetical protein I6G57_18290 [Burkholderia oklahomensis]
MRDVRLSRAIRVALAVADALARRRLRAPRARRVALDAGIVHGVLGKRRLRRALAAPRIVRVAVAAAADRFSIAHRCISRFSHEFLARRRLRAVNARRAIRNVVVIRAVRGAHRLASSTRRSSIRPGDLRGIRRPLFLRSLPHAQFDS